MTLKWIKLNLICLDYTIGIGIIACQPFGFYNITSILFYTSFVVSMLLWGVSIIDGLSEIDILALIIIAISFMHIVINGAAMHADFSFQYFKKYIMFCSTILFYSAARKITPGKNTSNFLKYMLLMIGLLLLIMYLISDRQMHRLNGQYTRYLTFGFTNPNLTAMFLSCMVMLLFIYGIQEKTWILKAVLLSLTVIEVLFIYQTESRNSFLVTIAFLGLAIYMQLFRKLDYKFPNWILRIISVFPMIFAIGYLWFIHSPTVAGLFSFLVGEGKSLDSRVVIWERGITAIKNSPILGAYYQISNGTGMSQMHNSHVDVLVSYGASVFGLFCVYLYKIIKNIQLINHGCVKALSLIAFISTIFLGMGEAALFSGGMGIYLFSGIFLMLANQPQEM